MEESPSHYFSLEREIKFFVLTQTNIDTFKDCKEVSNLLAGDFYSALEFLIHNSASNLEFPAIPCLSEENTSIEFSDEKKIRLTNELMDLKFKMTNGYILQNNDKSNLEYLLFKRKLLIKPFSDLQYTDLMLTYNTWSLLGDYIYEHFTQAQPEGFASEILLQSDALRMKLFSNFSRLNYFLRFDEENDVPFMQIEDHMIDLMIQRLDEINIKNESLPILTKNEIDFLLMVLTKAKKKEYLLLIQNYSI